MSYNSQQIKDIFEANTELVDYVKKLDKIRWEYLRESDAYRRDWELCKQEDYRQALEEYQTPLNNSACDECSLEECPEDCEYNSPPREGLLFLMSGDVNSFHLSLKKDSIFNKTWIRYGANAIADPAWSYEEVIKYVIEKRSDGQKLIFYDLRELSIYEGTYKNVKYENSPFVNLTVNVALPINLLTKHFRDLILLRKKEFSKLDKNKVLYKKWILPKNVHFDTLEEALKHYKMHVREGMSFHDIAHSLAAEFKASMGGKIHENDDPKSRFYSLAKKNIAKARNIMKNVEKGIFP